MVQVPGPSAIELYTTTIYSVPNKLECLFLQAFPAVSNVCG
jgi:hypothetical protein